MTSETITAIAWILGIVGTFGIIALGINGFFLKGIFGKINDVELKVVAMITGSESKERRISTLEDEVRDLRDKFHRANTEIHQMKSLELFKEKQI